MFQVFKIHLKFQNTPPEDSAEVKLDAVIVAQCVAYHNSDVLVALNVFVGVIQ